VHSPCLFMSLFPSHLYLSPSPPSFNLRALQCFPGVEWAGWWVVTPGRHCEFGRGAARAGDTHVTPTQSHISPSVLVYED
jgi:hypothetical protein